MLQKTMILMIALAFSIVSFAQNDYMDAQAENEEKIYNGGETYDVKTFAHKFKTDQPKNIILMIGDGMGVAQVYAGLTANGGRLFLDNFKHVGFSKTYSSDNYITDSAAGGTALSSGVKTYNGAIGVDPEKKPVKTILEKAEDKGLATGLVSTSSITHATPASFIAHQANRNQYEDIAADFLKTDIDVFIGGGYDHFANRKDGKNLVEKLKNNGYKVEQDISKISKVKKGKLAGLTAPAHNGRIEERGAMLEVATETALNILKRNKKGFFLMVEGSQIDWGGHAGSTIYVIEDMLDFDKTIGRVLEFAAKDGETLVIVTSDHETGGMAILNGDYNNGMVRGEFTTGGHTGLMVPIFSYGPGAEKFTGIMNNTDINKKMEELLINN